MFCKNCGSPIPEGAPTCPFCGVAVPRDQKDSRRIYVRPDYCCLCGRPLTEGHAVLFTYQSGDEARVDANCCNMLSALYNKDDPKKMALAVKAIRARIPDLDPAVADHLQVSLRQADEFLSGKAPEQQRYTREVSSESARREAALKQARQRRERRGLKIALIITLTVLLIAAAALLAFGVIKLPFCAPGAPEGSTESVSVSTSGPPTDTPTPEPPVTDPPRTPTPAPPLTPVPGAEYDEVGDEIIY